MNWSLSFIWHPSNNDSQQAIRYLLYLRLIMLAVTIVSLLTWDVSFEPFEQWPVAIALLISVALWSAAVLLSDKLQTYSNAQLREILIDIGWIFGIVFFAGRATNPFIYYFLVNIALAATLLSNRKAWGVCVLSIVLYSTLLLIDVQAHFAHFSQGYRLHLIGMWVNFLVSAIVICFFVTRLMMALRHQHNKMIEIREKNLKNEQLIGLATVSASTVHNLATPLSTLNVLIEEIASARSFDEETSSDLNLMRKQINRCQSTMKELSGLAESGDNKVVLKVSTLIDNLASHYALHFPNQQPKISDDTNGNELILCTPLFQYALINLINNAIESSQGDVSIHMRISQSQLRFAITNITKEKEDTFLARWGKPSATDKETGLGIGSFLSNSTIEQQGGTVVLDMQPSTQGAQQSQVTISVLFPLVYAQVIEQAQSEK